MTAGPDADADPRPHNGAPAGALEGLADLQTPWEIRVAATLGIAERLRDGPASAVEIAAATGCDAHALDAMLRHLASRGVFEESVPGRFAVNEAARALCGPASFHDLEGIGGRMAYSWGTLLTYVRTGRPAYSELYDRPFWEDLATHPEVAASFDALMGVAGHGVPDAALELSEGWDGISTVVDVGGGTGAMLAELLRLHPGLRGTLVDLPDTVDRSALVFVEAGVADRVTVAGQSFFEPLPAGADLYLLKKVLNDWPDDETVRILRGCAEAARPAGRVVVLGGVSPDAEPHPLTVDMVLVGGRTNTLSEFTQLAAGAGLAVVAAARQRPGYVVELRPV